MKHSSLSIMLLFLIVSDLIYASTIEQATDYPQLTNLPTVYIETQSGKDPTDKKNQLPCTITIVSDNGQNILQEPGTVRLRGNSTMKRPKKPYRIKFDKKQNVLDAPSKAKKWTLLANYGDKSLMRNAVAFYIARQIGMEYVPYLTPVDIVVNGDYKGNYQLCDQIEVRKGRVNIDELTASDNTPPNITGGYLLEVDGYAEWEPRAGWFLSNHSTPVTFKSPDSDEITREQRLYIQHEFNYMEEHWRETLDLESFLKHFLVEELMANKDAYWSVYMYKRRNDPMIYTGPVWDFDLAMDNNAQTFPINWIDGWSFENGGASAGFMRKLTHEVVHSKDIKKKMQTMWAEFRQNALSTDSIIAFIDAYAEYIDESQQLNFERWDILGKRVFHNPLCYYTYDGEVEALRVFIRERMCWMDDKLGYTAPEDDASYHNSEHISFNPNQKYQIYTTMGEIMVAEPQKLPTGIYIMRQGQTTHKVFIP